MNTYLGMLVATFVGCFAIGFGIYLRYLWRTRGR